MKLGTVVYDKKIYNLDYMTLDELSELLKKIEETKKSVLEQAKAVVNGEN